MKRVKEFFKKHIRKIVLGIFILIAIAHFIVNFEIVQNTKLMEESWVNLINGYILILTMFAGLIFLIWLAFLINRDTAKDLEKFLLKNLTTACFLIIFFLILQGKSIGLDGKSILTGLGAIMLFWYGYKTYERDKEIELIQFYSEKYIDIQSKIELVPHNKAELIKNFRELINLWYSEFHLANQGYISENLWHEWEAWIKSDVLTFVSLGWFGSSMYGDVKGFDSYFIRAIETMDAAIPNKKGTNLSWGLFLKSLSPAIKESLAQMDFFLSETQKNSKEFQELQKVMLNFIERHS